MLVVYEALGSNLTVAALEMGCGLLLQYLDRLSFLFSVGCNDY